MWAKNLPTPKIWGFPKICISRGFVAVWGGMRKTSTIQMNLCFLWFLDFVASYECAIGTDVNFERCDRNDTFNHFPNGTVSSINCASVFLLQSTFLYFTYSQYCCCIPNIVILITIFSPIEPPPTNSIAGRRTLRNNGTLQGSIRGNTVCLRQ